MKRAVGLLVVILIAAAGWFAWVTFFPSDERRIRARLDEIVDTVNARSSDGLSRIADAARLASFFTEDVTIDPGPPYPVMQGRDAILAAASAAGRGAGGFELAFVDVQVAMGGTGTATAHLTLTLTWPNVQTSGSTVDAREVQLALREEAGEWRVAGGAPVQTLQR